MRIRRTDLSKDHAGLGENEKKGVLQRNKNQGKHFNLLNLSKAQCLVPFHFLDEDAKGQYISKTGGLMYSKPNSSLCALVRGFF